MKLPQLQLLPVDQVPFTDYQASLGIDIEERLRDLQALELTPQSFKFYTSVSVISSSKIEGEQMEVDSYVKHKMQDIEYLPDLTEKPNDLFNAYTYAQNTKLTRSDFLHAHDLLTLHLLPGKYRGVCRQNNMVVLEHNTGRIQYEAAPANMVKDAFDKLWNDIDLLLSSSITVAEQFYYASLIHLVFVNIHPFNDGNGRAARLLEKWFLSAFIGERAWLIPNEKYYYAHVNDYYKYLASQGMFYEELNYRRALPLLLMLPGSLA